MKAKLVIALVLTVAAQGAFAQYYGPYGHDPYLNRNDSYGRYERERDYRYDGRGRYENRRRDAPDTYFQPGHQIPPQHYNPQSALENWAAHGLPAPVGADYKWFLVGNEYVQVNITNGIIGMVHAFR